VTSTSGGDPAGGLLARAELPILEFDPARTAMIEPSIHLCSPGADGAAVDMPERAVVCFFGDVVAEVAAERGARRVVDLVSEHGRHTVWEIEADGGERVAFFQPGIGAPLAAFFLEEAICYGVRKVVACGGAGALVPELVLGHPIVVTGAVRDEGTSYHYLPPARTVRTDPSVVATLETVLRRSDVPYTAGLTWTTDAPYRETPGKVAARREEGCLTVEMEAAALLAVAGWREVSLGQYLYAGDALHGEEWDHRDWMSAGEVRRRLFWLAVEACLAL
jgi:uridine phosphorylase